MLRHTAEVIQIRNRARNPLFRLAQIRRQFEPEFLFRSPCRTHAVLDVAPDGQDPDVLTLRARLRSLGGGHARSIKLCPVNRCEFPICRGADLDGNIQKLALNLPKGATGRWLYSALFADADGNQHHAQYSQIGVYRLRRWMPAPLANLVQALFAVKGEPSVPDRETKLPFGEVLHSLPGCHDIYGFQGARFNSLFLEAREHVKSSYSGLRESGGNRPPLRTRKETSGHDSGRTNSTFTAAFAEPGDLR